MPDKKYKNVRALQKFLSKEGYDPGAIDNSWGPNTEKAFKLYMSDNPQYDGISADIFSSAYDLTPLPLRAFIEDIGVSQFNKLSPIDIKQDALTEKDLKRSQLKKLREIVRTNLSEDKTTISYSDYGTDKDDPYRDVSGRASNTEIADKGFFNPGYQLKSTIGQANIVTTPTDTFVVDQGYNFNKGQGNSIFNQDAWKDAANEIGKKPTLYTVPRELAKQFGSVEGEGRGALIKTTEYSHGGAVHDDSKKWRTAPVENSDMSNNSTLLQDIDLVDDLPNTNQAYLGNLKSTNPIAYAATTAQNKAGVGIAKNTAEWSPVTGEIMDANMLKNDLRDGNYGMAGLSAAGFMLPLVPGTAIKKAFKKLFSKGTPTSLDWAKFNAEIPNNKELMREYGDIEAAARKDGSWMKGSDGSDFGGTSEQFVQQNSSNFKKAFPTEWERMYHGSADGSLGDLNQSKNTRKAYGEGLYTTSGVEEADKYAGKLKRIPNTKGKTYELAVGTEGANNFTFQDKKYLAKWNKSDLKSKKELLEEYKTKVGRDMYDYEWEKMSEYVGTTENIPSNMRDVSKPIILEGGYHNKWVIAKERIKALEGNNGMFDMSNPNIHKKYGGKVTKYQHGGPHDPPNTSAASDNTNVTGFNTPMEAPEGMSWNPATGKLQKSWDGSPQSGEVTPNNIIPELMFPVGKSLKLLDKGLNAIKTVKKAGAITPEYLKKMTTNIVKKGDNAIISKVLEPTKTNLKLTGTKTDVKKLDAPKNERHPVIESDVPLTHTTNKEGIVVEGGKVYKKISPQYSATREGARIANRSTTHFSSGHIGNPGHGSWLDSSTSVITSADHLKNKTQFLDLNPTDTFTYNKRNLELPSTSTIMTRDKSLYDKIKKDAPNYNIQLLEGASNEAFEKAVNIKTSSLVERGDRMQEGMHKMNAYTKAHFDNTGETLGIYAEKGTIPTLGSAHESGLHYNTMLRDASQEHPNTAFLERINSKHERYPADILQNQLHKLRTSKLPKSEVSDIENAWIKEYGYKNSKDLDTQADAIYKKRGFKYGGKAMKKLNKYPYGGKGIGNYGMGGDFIAGALGGLAGSIPLVGGAAQGLVNSTAEGMGADPNSTAAQVGNLAGGIGSTLINPAGVAGNLGKLGKFAGMAKGLMAEDGGQFSADLEAEDGEVVVGNATVNPKYNGGYAKQHGDLPIFTLGGKTHNQGGIGMNVQGEDPAYIFSNNRDLKVPKMYGKGGTYADAANTIGKDLAKVSAMEKGDVYDKNTAKRMKPALMGKFKNLYDAQEDFKVKNGFSNPTAMAEDGGEFGGIDTNFQIGGENGLFGEGYGQTTGLASTYGVGGGGNGSDALFGGGQSSSKTTIGGDNSSLPKGLYAANAIPGMFNMAKGLFGEAPTMELDRLEEQDYFDFSSTMNAYDSSSNRALALGRAGLEGSGATGAQLRGGYQAMASNSQANAGQFYNQLAPKMQQSRIATDQFNQGIHQQNQQYGIMEDQFAMQNNPINSVVTGAEQLVSAGTNLFMDNKRLNNMGTANYDANGNFIS